MVYILNLAFDSLRGNLPGRINFKYEDDANYPNAVEKKTTIDWLKPVFNSLVVPFAVFERENTVSICLSFLEK